MTRALPLLLLLSCSAQALERADTTRVYLLGEVVVTGRGGAVVGASSVTDIDRETISIRDALAIAEAITLTPGIYLHTNARSEAVPYMRGFEPRQAAMFLDGVPLALPFDGTVDLSLLTTSHVGKITTTRGMSSILYGPNSMGGTINIVTAEPASGLGGAARLQGGSSRAAVLSLGAQSGQLSWYLAGQYAHTDDFPLPSSLPQALQGAGSTRANSTSRGYSLLAKVGTVPIDGTRLTLSLLHTDNPKGVPTNIYTSRPRYWRFTEWRKTVLTLAGETLLGASAGLKGTVFYQSYYNVLDSYDDATFSSQNARYAFRSTYDDYSFGATLIASISSPLDVPLKLIASGRRDVHREQPTESAPTARFTAETYAMGVEQEGTFGPFSGVLGLGIDLLHPSETAGGELRPSAHAWAAHGGLVWSAGPAMSIHAHLGHRSRFPTLKELYSEHLGLNLPNPNLGAERSWNLEAGVTVAPAPATELRLALFYSDVRGLIQNVFLDATTRQLQNLGKAALTGLEYSGRAALEGHTLEANYTFLVAENRSAGARSQVLEHRPRHIVTLAASVALPADAALRAEAFYVSSRSSVDLDDGSWEELEGYWLLNLRAALPLLSWVEAFGRINNLTDTYYESEYGYTQPGRTFVAGLQSSF